MKTTLQKGFRAARLKYGLENPLNFCRDTRTHAREATIQGSYKDSVSDDRLTAKITGMSAY